MASQHRRVLREKKHDTRVRNRFHRRGCPSLTEGHLNLVCYALDTHECERDHSDHGYHRPAQLLDEGERQGKQVQRDALLQVDAICAREQVAVRNTLIVKLKNDAYKTWV